MLGRFATFVVTSVLVLAPLRSIRAEVTAEQVNAAIANGVAYLEKQQQPGGNWSEYTLEPGGVTALCTLALLNCGRTPADASVKKGLDYLERMQDPDRIYSVALTLMAFAQADPKKYALKIKQRAMWIEAKQMKGELPHKGGWRYKGDEGLSDNSSTQFAILALHEAERAGIKVSDQTWQLAANYWTQRGMQNPDGSFRYEYEEGPDKASGSMTCAGIACLIILRDRLHAGDAAVTDGKLQCCGNQSADDSVERALAWMGQHFSVSRNPGDPRWLLYYLYGLERVGRMSGQRYFFSSRNGPNGGIIEQHDWYREGCEYLVANQDKLLNSWIGIGGQGSGEGDNPAVSTSFALLFLSKGRRPVVMAKLKYQADNAARPLEWDHHRRAVQNLTMRVEKEEAWKRDLSWQTIDFVPRAGQGGPRLLVSAADLLEAPVLFLSGSAALNFDANQKVALKNYVENGQTRRRTREAQRRSEILAFLAFNLCAFAPLREIPSPQSRMHRSINSYLLLLPSCPSSLCGFLLVAFLLLSGSLRAQQPPRPNIVFILMDDLRADELACTGHPFVQTPNIDRLAKEGALFTNAFATSPLCSPSRSCFLTGHYAHKTGITDNVDRSPQSHQLITWPRLLHDAGYETAFVGKWHMGVDDSPRPGFDHWVCVKGQGRYTDPDLNIDGQQTKGTGYVTDLFNQHAVAFLNRTHVGRASGRPLCLFLAHKCVHPDLEQRADGSVSDPNAATFLPAERHKTLYANEKPPRRPNAFIPPLDKPALARKIDGLPPLSRETATDDETIRNRLRLLMAAEEGVGQILAALEKSGQLDDTMIVFTSDHGYFYGEHCLSVERRLAYEEAIRIPLLIRYPPVIKPNTRLDPFILSIDLAPTLLAAAGAPIPPGLHGRSFLPLLKNESYPPRESFLIEHFSDNVFPRMQNLGYQAIRTSRHKYIRYTDLQSADELYDLEADPYELKNLIRESTHLPTLQTLKAELQQLLAQTRE